MTIVVKLGGSVGNEAAHVLDEIARRTDVLLVHGGSAEIDQLAQSLGRPPDHYTSPSGVVSRRTTAADLEVVTLALAGGVQTRLVAGLVARGAHAVGLSGVDGPWLTTRRKTGVRARIDGRTVELRDDLSGTIERVDPTLLRSLLAGGIVPVLGPPAITSGGEVVNVDADRIAAAVAGALPASDLILLTNVPGFLREPSDPGSLIRTVGSDEIANLLPLARGRMRKKVLAAQEALAAGVPRVVVAPSGVDRPIAAALAGGGTVFR